jgi:hypothetical protein
MVEETIQTNGAAPHAQAEQMTVECRRALRDAHKKVAEILAIADVAETALHVDNGDAVDRDSVPRLLGMIVEHARGLQRDIDTVSSAVWTAP